jgi:hypothetical protein
VKPLPYLLPWVRVLLLVRSITSTTWGHEAWPQVKPVLRRALEIRGWEVWAGKRSIITPPMKWSAVVAGVGLALIFAWSLLQPEGLLRTVLGWATR